jgi:hypothetical protein
VESHGDRPHGTLPTPGHQALLTPKSGVYAADFRPFGVMIESIPTHLSQPAKIPTELLDPWFRIPAVSDVRD